MNIKAMLLTLVCFLIMVGMVIGVVGKVYWDHLGTWAEARNRNMDNTPYPSGSGINSIPFHEAFNGALDSDANPPRRHHNN